MSEEKKESGDRRVWTAQYEEALAHIDSGNIAEARKILTELAAKAPHDEIRKDATQKLEQFKVDPVGYVLFGISLLVLVVIILKWVF